MSGREAVHDLLVSYRSGDMWAPKIEATEALKAELAYFAECITKDEVPFNGGMAGLRVVRMLEAAEESASGVAAGAVVAVSVVDVDDLEPSLHAQAKPEIAAINNNFFMM